MPDKLSETIKRLTERKEKRDKLAQLKAERDRIGKQLSELRKKKK